MYVYEWWVLICMKSTPMYTTGFVFVDASDRFWRALDVIGFIFYVFLSDLSIKLDFYPPNLFDTPESKKWRGVPFKPPRPADVQMAKANENDSLLMLGQQATPSPQKRVNEPSPVHMDTSQNQCNSAKSQGHWNEGRVQRTSMSGANANFSGPTPAAVHELGQPLSNSQHQVFTELNPTGNPVEMHSLIKYVADVYHYEIAVSFLHSGFSDCFTKKYGNY